MTSTPEQFPHSTAHEVGTMAYTLGPKGRGHEMVIEQMKRASSEGASLAERKALMGAEKSLRENTGSYPDALSDAQRTMESTQTGAARWTDTLREVAVDLNTEQRLMEGRPPTSFGDALTEMKSYASEWQGATSDDGEKNEWLNQKGVSLDYCVKAAERGDVEGLGNVLATVEALLLHNGVLTDRERGAAELRDLRDALFIEKRRLELEAQKTPEQQATQARKEGDVAQARVAVLRALSKSSL